MAEDRLVANSATSVEARVAKLKAVPPTRRAQCGGKALYGWGNVWMHAQHCGGRKAESTDRKNARALQARWEAGSTWNRCIGQALLTGDKEQAV